ncbi:flagellar biosynthetic protein FliR [Plastoroseomonas arctica]|uniref:Type III secretion protein n=1 Tax=Plastoroseomonas arctica TaxID=1509237 RepID=A0AAF1KMG9_9PROT|nr:flagellar biosynthetic protein FliR [Plastoroseomonas arctica]MBR0656396.1 type III secretion protein [Plastoroseomonas arctica]
MSEAELVAALPALAFQAALLFARVGAAAMLLPGLGEQEVSPQIRLALGLAMVPLLLPALAPALPQAPDDAAAAVLLVLLEILVGVWLGGLARLVTLAFAVTGQAVALMLGLASALVPDAQFGGQGTATSRMFALLAIVLVLGTGLYMLPLRALAQSYAVLPAGGAWPAGDAAETFTQAAADSFTLALQLAAPFMLGGIVLNVALGLLTRLAPQVQIYFVAIPGQILAGIALLALLLPAMLGAYADAARFAFAGLPGNR